MGILSGIDSNSKERPHKMNGKVIQTKEIMSPTMRHTVDAEDQKDEESENEGSVGSGDDHEDEGLEDVEHGGGAEDDLSLKRPHSEGDEAALKTKKAKLSMKQLFKPPTTDELNQLHETENLFHSNLFRLQIEEMLQELKVKEKYTLLFDSWFKQFKETVTNLEDMPRNEITQQTWLKKMKVCMPIQQNPYEVKGSFSFSSPSDVKLIGSYSIGSSLGPDVRVDIKLEIPRKNLQSKDHRNQVYLRKRALYLAFIAGKLRKSNLVEEMHFTYHAGDVLRPVLQVKPKGKLGKRFLIVLHAALPSETFKLSLLSPARNNIRTSWFFEQEDGEDENLPTPHYNNSILIDLTLDVNEEYRSRILESHPNLKEGIMLLSVWLRQRELDQGFGSFSSYIISMFVLYLLQNHKINRLMSSYQVVRNTWNSLAEQDWTSKGISVAQAGKVSAPPIRDFHEAFDVVFLDVSGFTNLCANMNKTTFMKVRREAELAVKYLDNPNMNSFQALFMTPMPFYRQHDHVIWFHNASELASAVIMHGNRKMSLDFCGYTYPQAQNIIVDLLLRGLGERVHLLSIKFPSVARWPVSEEPPSIDCTLTLGLLLNQEFAFDVVNKGPPANLPEAKEFTDFWKEKSELRRFKDGSICEALTWEGQSLSDKRVVCKQIVNYLVKVHLDIDNYSVMYLADQLDPLLQPCNIETPLPVYGTGEEATLAVIKAYDDLGSHLRNLKDMPLHIASVQGISSVCRYTDVFPPLASSVPAEDRQFGAQNNCVLFRESTNIIPRWTSPIEVVIQLGLTRKWPSKLEAVRRIRAAFHIHLAKSLQEQFGLITQPFVDHFDVCKSGFVFRVQVACPREISLLQMTKTPLGVIEYKENEKSLALEKRIIHLPKLTSALHGLHQQYSSYGPACCLAKRWVSAQLLADHIPEMCIELLTASLYLSPEPYTIPMQPQVAFIRFLNLMKDNKWKTDPVILNFNNELSRQDIVEIENKFNSMRSELPPLFIVSSYDKFNSIWTKTCPTPQILVRAAQLATASLNLIEDFYSSAINADWKQIFRPPMDVYDVLLHLNMSKVVHREEGVDFKRKNQPYKLLPHEEEEKKLPISGFDPVQFYLKELREVYGEYALFFYDKYGGEVIGVLWKPPALEPKEFKVSQVKCHKVIDKDAKGKAKVALNIDAIIEDFYILGAGLVKSIEVQRNVQV